MSDIQEEQKRLYKRAEENDIKLLQEEIKEILESLDKISKAEYYPEDLLTYKECQLLLDYITNLQEENEKVHKDFDELSERYFFTKSRNEKAIEYINNCPEYLWANVNTKSLLNILQGVDKE